MGLWSGAVWRAKCEEHSGARDENVIRLKCAVTQVQAQ